MRDEHDCDGTMCAVAIVAAASGFLCGLLGWALGRWM